MIQILSASESSESSKPYGLKVFSQNYNEYLADQYWFCTLRLRVVVVRSICDRFLASLKEVKELALNYLGQVSRGLDSQFHIKNKCLKWTHRELMRQAFFLRDLKELQECIDGVEGCDYQYGTAKKEKEIENKKEEMFLSVFKKQPPEIQEDCRKIFKDCEELKIFRDAMYSFAFYHLPKSIQESYFKEIGIDINREEFVERVLGMCPVPLNDIKYESLGAGKKALEDLIEDLKKLKKELVAMNYLEGSAYKEFEYNNRFFNKHEYVYLEELKVNHLGEFQKKKKTLMLKQKLEKVLL